MYSSGPSDDLGAPGISRQMLLAQFGFKTAVCRIRVAILPHSGLPADESAISNSVIAALVPAPTHRCVTADSDRQKKGLAEKNEFFRYRISGKRPYNFEKGEDGKAFIQSRGGQIGSHFRQLNICSGKLHPHFFAARWYHAVSMVQEVHSLI
jgi:hypothetical protein